MIMGLWYFCRLILWVFAATVEVIIPILQKRKLKSGEEACISLYHVSTGSSVLILLKLMSNVPPPDHKWSELQIECYQRGHGSMRSAGGQTYAPPPHRPGSSGPGYPLHCFPPVCFFSSCHHVQLFTLVHREKLHFFSFFLFKKQAHSLAFSNVFDIFNSDEKKKQMIAAGPLLIWHFGEAAGPSRQNERSILSPHREEVLHHVEASVLRLWGNRCSRRQPAVSTSCLQSFTCSRNTS